MQIDKHVFMRYVPPFGQFADWRLYEVRRQEMPSGLLVREAHGRRPSRIAAEKLDAQLEALAKEFKTQLEPYASQHVAAQHNIFDYLLHDCGFELPIPIYAEPETPPSPAEIANLAKEFKEHGVKVIFTEPQYPDELAALLAKETGSTAVKLDPVASGPVDPPAGYYVDTMTRNLELMKKALAE